MHEILIYESYIAGAKCYFIVNDIAQIKTALPELKKDFENFSTTSKEEYEKAKETLITAEEDMAEAKKAFVDANQACDEYKSVLPNLIAVIGIFIAIIIAIIAVYLSMLLKDSKQLISVFFVVDTVWAKISLILFLAIFTFDLLFMFIFWIAKLSGRSVSCNCVHGDCNGCEKSCGFRLRVFRKYWNVVIMNGFVLLSLIACIFLHYYKLSPADRKLFKYNKITTTEAEINGIDTEKSINVGSLNFSVYSTTSDK